MFSSRNCDKCLTVYDSEAKWKAKDIQDRIIECLFWYSECEIFKHAYSLRVEVLGTLQDCTRVMLGNKPEMLENKPETSENKLDCGRGIESELTKTGISE